MGTLLQDVRYGLRMLAKGICGYLRGVFAGTPYLFSRKRRNWWALQTFPSQQDKKSSSPSLPCEEDQQLIVEASRPLGERPAQACIFF
jgi:hypothetical protein